MEAAAASAGDCRWSHGEDWVTRDLVAELRALAAGSDWLRERIAEFSPQEAADGLFSFVAVDAALRAAVALGVQPEPTAAEPDQQEPPAPDPESFVGIDDTKALIRGVIDALSDAEARFVLFEGAFRSLVERAQRRRGSDAT